MNQNRSPRYLPRAEALAEASTAAAYWYNVAQRCKRALVEATDPDQRAALEAQVAAAEQLWEQYHALVCAWTAAPARLQVGDVQQAFAWIRAELVKDGCAADEQAAGTLEARLVDIEVDIIGYLTDRAQLTPAA